MGETELMPTPEGGHDRDEYEVAEKIFFISKKYCRPSWVTLGT